MGHSVAKSLITSYLSSLFWCLKCVCLIKKNITIISYIIWKSKSWCIITQLWNIFTSDAIFRNSWIWYKTRLRKDLYNLDGNSEISAHFRSNLCYLICLRHLNRSRVGTNHMFLPEKPFFHSCVRNQFWVTIYYMYHGCIWYKKIRLFYTVSCYI